MTFKILLVKESRAGETRVALIPSHVKELISLGHTIYVEHNAGSLAGFPDNEYESAGATIRYDDDQLFSNITHIIRVKRPERSREMLENKTIAPGTIMVGALDPLERHSPHLEEYKTAGIHPHSIDQLSLPSNHPMNILAAMSKMAGRLALRDAISKFQGKIEKIVIVGFGVAGQAALHEAIELKWPVTVMLHNPQKAQEVEAFGGKCVILDHQSQQEMIKQEVLDASIVITAARRNNEVAPILIPNETLKVMQPGSVIVDLALSEGGNVEGSEHDATLTLGNDVIVTNVSGYPKAEPRAASELWSRASLEYLKQL